MSGPLFSCWTSDAGDREGACDEEAGCWCFGRTGGWEQRRAHRRRAVRAETAAWGSGPGAGLQLTPHGATGIWVGGRGLHPSSRSSPQRPQLRTQLSPPSDSRLAAVLPTPRAGPVPQHRKGCGVGAEDRAWSGTSGWKETSRLRSPGTFRMGQPVPPRAAVGVCPPPSARSTAGHLFLISKWHYVITTGWMCIFVLFAGVVGR